MQSEVFNTTSGDMLPHPPDTPESVWIKDAQCVGVPEIFYGPGDNVRRRASQDSIDAAKEICRQCLSIEPCLETSLSQLSAHDVGIAGGLTKDERDKIRKQRAKR